MRYIIRKLTIEREVVLPLLLNLAKADPCHLHFPTLGRQVSRFPQPTPKTKPKTRSLARLQAVSFLRAEVHLSLPHLIEAIDKLWPTKLRKYQEHDSGPGEAISFISSLDTGGWDPKSRRLWSRTRMSFYAHEKPTNKQHHKTKTDKLCPSGGAVIGWSDMRTEL
jgi:hypothetical protein